MATEARLTADDLLRMPEEDLRRELVNGEIIEMPLANALHADLTGLLFNRLAEHVAKHSAGKVLVGDAGFVLNLPSDPDRVRGVDVAFVSDERLPEARLPEKFLHGAPDLAVEILSPSESSAYLQQKVSDYLEAGARLVWLIAPQAKTATVYRADGSARFLREHDQLEGEAVLPGLVIPLSELFA